MEDFNRFHLNTTHPSLYSQPMQTNPYYSDPNGASAHSVQPLQTNVYEESKKVNARIARANRKQVLANKKSNPSSSSKRPSKRMYSACNIKGGDQDDKILYTQDNVVSSKFYIWEIII